MEAAVKVDEGEVKVEEVEVKFEEGETSGDLASVVKKEETE